MILFFIFNKARQNYCSSPLMKNNKQELNIFNSIFLSTNHPHNKIEKSHSRFKILPCINTLNHYFQPIDYKLYDKLKRRQRLHLLKTQQTNQSTNIKSLHLQGEMAHFSTLPARDTDKVREQNFIETMNLKSRPRRQNMKIYGIMNATRAKHIFQNSQLNEQIKINPIVSQALNFQQRISPIPKKITPIIFQHQKLFSTKSSSERAKEISLKSIVDNHKSVSLIENHYKCKQQKPLVMLDKHELSQIKAESYLVMEYPSMKVIAGNRYKHCAEIASLTKIMTFYTLYQIALQHGQSNLAEIVKIDEETSEMSGTTAELLLGDLICIKDLLYGLMLPSGNDAALALAKWGGNLLKSPSEDIPPYNTFISAMNRYAKRLGLKQSIFANPHGLPNNRNSSNPYDIALLIGQCMKIPLFCKVISTKTYSTWIHNQGIKRQLLWENTNKLLRRKGFIGVKTGVTVTAGPCLATCYQKQDKKFITVLLRANKLSRRFKETRLILGSVLKKYNPEIYSSDCKQLIKNDNVLDSDNSEDEQEFKYEKMDARQFEKRNKILVYQL